MFVAVFVCEFGKEVVGEVVTLLARPGDNFSLTLLLLFVLILIDELAPCFKRKELFVIGFCIGAEPGEVEDD